MAKKQKEKPEQTITINDVEHNVSDLSEAQVAMVNHLHDLDRKIGSSQFNLDQLNVGMAKFKDMFVASVNVPNEEEKKDDDSSN